mgnify:CR=1 FL=1
MIWTVAKAMMLVVGVLVVWVTVDLLWRRAFGVVGDDETARGGCGTGCMCTRRGRTCERETERDESARSAAA